MTDKHDQIEEALSEALSEELSEEERDQIELEVMDREEQTCLMTAETMKASIVRHMIEELKHMPTTWQKLNEEGQDKILFRVEEAAKEAVEEAVALIAANSSEVIHTHLDSVNFKNGVSAKLTMNKCESAYDLARHEGSQVLLVIPDSERFISGQANEDEMPKADKDQPDLDLD